MEEKLLEGHVIQEQAVQEQAIEAQALRPAQVVDLLERITDAFYALGTDWRFLYVNHQAARMLGRPPENLIGRHIWDEFPDAAHQPTFRAYHQVMSEQAPRQIEHFSAVLDRWIEYRIYPAPYGLCVFLLDVTARKQEEKALQAATLRLETLIENLQAGVIVEDSQAQLVLTNQAFCAMMGLKGPPGALVGANVSRMARRTSLLFPDPEAFMARALLLRQRQEPVPAEELVLTDGQVWERDYVPVFPGVGDGHQREGHGGHLWLFRDVTERRRTEQRIQEAAGVLAFQKAELETINAQMERTNAELAQANTRLGEANTRLGEANTQLGEANARLGEANQRLADANARLEALATTDGLTGLFNHRVLMERIEEEWRRSRRYGEPLSLIMLDVDRFKDFNDRFGHAAGNEALRQVADVLRRGVRETDVLARYGGEEFAVILPHTGCAEAGEIAERLRAAVAAQAWEHRRITVSAGVCDLTPAMADVAALLECADRAMYGSKSAGRNRVTSSCG